MNMIPKNDTGNNLRGNGDGALDFTDVEITVGGVSAKGKGSRTLVKAGSITGLLIV